MKVTVISVDPAPNATLWLGHGVREDGCLVTFGGDWRPMRDILRSIEAGEDVEVDVPGWSIVNVEEPLEVT